MGDECGLSPWGFNRSPRVASGAFCELRMALVGSKGCAAVWAVLSGLSLFILLLSVPHKDTMSARRRHIPGRLGWELSAHLPSSPCSNLSDGLSYLVDHWLRHHKQHGVRPSRMLLEESSWKNKIYIKNNTVYVPRELMVPGMYLDYARMLAKAADKFPLPDVIIPINVADVPVVEAGDTAVIFSFCNRPTSRDILLPYPHVPTTSHIGVLPCDEATGWEAGSCVGFTPSRAGLNDTRIPKAVWRGAPRNARRKRIAELGEARPDLLDAGMNKPGVALRQQVDTYKYTLNVGGHCASFWLAKQLLSDALVMKVETSDLEFYYPLLQPYVHYVPLVGYGQDDFSLPQQIRWAEAHPEVVSSIVNESTALALKYLTEEGMYCYIQKLMEEYQKLFEGEWSLGADMEGVLAGG